MGTLSERERKNRNISKGVSKLTPEAIQKLEQLFSLDASLGEMCSYLDVSYQTIYNWEKANPKLFEKLNRMRDKPTLKIRQAAVAKATESYGNAMDYLKRKRKEEFGDTSTVNAHVTSELPEETKKSLDEIISKNKDAGLTQSA